MMNKTEILKKIGSIVSELKEQHEYLSQSPDNLNELELELFSANAHFLSDHIAILVKLNGNLKVSGDISDGRTEPKESLKTDKVESPHEAIENEEIPVTKSEIISDMEPVREKEPIINSELERKDDYKENDSALIHDDKPIIEEDISAGNEANEVHRGAVQYNTQHSSSNDIPVVKEVIISERTVALPIEQTVPDNPVPTVNDLLSKNSPQQTLGGQFSSQQVKDLKSMISLNDKLLFVRDLFNSYSLAYSEAIELLNRFESMEAAENFLKQNYALKNNWADKQVAADKFYELLSRRFAK